MYNDLHTYDLSFVAPDRVRRTKPQLVFTIHEQHLPELTKRLHTLASRWRENVYLEAPTEFILPLPDMFGRVEFGYGSCGSVTSEGQRLSLRLELSQKKLFHLTATIHLLTVALSLPFAEKFSNRLQPVSISTGCGKDWMHGHTVDGFISAEVHSWIFKKVSRLKEPSWSKLGPRPIVTAMKQAWRAVNTKEDQHWSTSCSARFTGDGRFILECLGDACDLAIYPDSLGMKGSSIEFGCHNLDQARQQITLLAGLAKLCELATKD